MARDNYAAHRKYQRCAAGLYDDPAVTGDLLLVGLWLARAIHLLTPDPADGGGWHWQTIGAELFGPGDRETRMVVRIIEGDIPHYSAHDDRGIPRWARTQCSAPMVRRDGSCGQHATMWTYVTVLETGRKREIGSCARHKPWYDLTVVKDREAVKAAGDTIPRAPYNVGGVLSRHIPDLDWERLWTSMRPGWIPGPGAGRKTKPRFSVFTTEIVELTDADRPMLRGINGGRSTGGAPSGPTPGSIA